MFVYGIAHVIVPMRLLLFPSTFWFVYRELLLLIRTCAFEWRHDTIEFSLFGAFVALL
jgi:hypothetical protein